LVLACAVRVHDGGAIRGGGAPLLLCRHRRAFAGTIAMCSDKGHGATAWAQR